MSENSSRRSRRTFLIGAVSAAAAMAAPSAHAQWVVIDPTNLAQNIIQVAHALEQINNQIQQIEQQAQMLAPSSLQLSPELGRSIEEARSLFDAAEGLSFEASRIGDDLRELYPETYSSFDIGEVLARSDRWLEESRASLEVAMRAEANASSSADRSRSAVERALSTSSEAEGQTGAVQAGNQVLGVLATQLAELQVLIAAQGRALETERMERVAREDRASEIRRRAFPARRPNTTPARTAF